MQPTIGRIVHYLLTPDDVAQIMRRRTNAESIRARIFGGTWPEGAQAHIGSDVTYGDLCALIVTRVTSNGADDLVNGKVLLDGSDVLWVQNVSHGTSMGQWSWPPLVK